MENKTFIIRHKKTLIIATVFILAGIIIFGLKVSRVNDYNNLSDLIIVDKPKTDETVLSPLLITGQARGYWFFEAGFPVKIYDSEGNQLGIAVAQTTNEWMTEDFIPFAAILEFSKPSSKTGTLVLEKDNPSGLPENDDKLIIPIRFD